MFKFIFLFLLSFNCLAEEWTTQDTQRESVFVAITAIDWSQTLQIAKRPDHYYETNIILGNHPSDSRINTLIPTAMLAHYYIATLLPRGYREAWQYAFIAVETNAVSNNFSIGLNVKF